MDKNRIYIVDDDIEWIKVISLFLNSFDDMLVVCTSSDKAEARYLATQIDFDVILMDISMDGDFLAGIKLAQEILEQIDTSIIMLTSLDEENVIKQSFNAGAIDYMCKDDYENLPYTIRKSLRKNAPNKILIKELLEFKKAKQLSKLTQVELEIFELSEKGYSRDMIVEALHRSPNTVKKQITCILKKLEASNIKEAVKKVNGKPEAL